ADDLLYGYVVSSAITRGKIKSLNTDTAQALDGVVKIFTHENRPKLAWFDIKYADMDAPPGSVFKPLDSAEIRYNGQPVALVVANDFETARYAATLLEIEYEEEAFETGLRQNLDKARKPKTGLATALKPPPPKPTGDFEKAFSDSSFKIDSEY